MDFDAQHNLLPLLKYIPSEDRGNEPALEPLHYWVLVWEMATHFVGPQYANNIS